MRIHLLLFAVLLCNSLSAQSLRYAKDQIPFEKDNEDVYFTSSGAFTHVWLYNAKKLSLYVYNENLKQVSKQVFHKMNEVSGFPLFLRSNQQDYYVISPAKKRNEVYKISEDGSFQEMTVSNSGAEMFPGKIEYAEEINGKFFVIEAAASTKDSAVYSIKKLDSTFQLIQQGLIKIANDSGRISSAYFKSIDDSTLLYGSMITDNLKSSTLTLSRLNINSGQTKRKLFVSNDSEFKGIKLVNGDGGNVFVVNQVLLFPADSSSTAIKETFYITKLTKEWEVKSSFSIEENTSADSSRSLNFFNVYTFPFNGRIATIDLCSDILIGGGLANLPPYRNGNEDRAAKLLMPIQTQEEIRWDRLTANKPVSDWPKQFDPKLEEKLDSRNLFPQQNIPASSDHYEEQKRIRFTPNVALHRLTIIDTSLHHLSSQLISSSVRYFPTATKLTGFYLKDNTIYRYEFHERLGAVLMGQFEINPLYQYMPWLMSKQNESSFILPYSFKKKIYFAKIKW